MEGQINPNTILGAEIIKLACDPKYFSYLDIGTWNGLGTTRCLVHGLQHKLGKIYSLEANARMLEIAKNNWTPLPDCLELIHGKLSNELMSAMEIESHPLFNDVKAHYEIHYKNDYVDDLYTPVVTLPKIDVAIMDGGEFCGAGDLKRVLSLNPSVIVLDDVKVMKNYDNLNKLIASKHWKLINRGDDRNGWAILERIV